MSILTLISEWQRLGPIGWAENDYGWILEDGQPVVFSDWQKATVGACIAQRGHISTLMLSTVKKAGKTTLNSILVAYRWLTIPSVHFVVGNDQSQAEELQFNQISAMVKRHPVLKRYTKITKDTITFTPTDSRIVSLPMDASGAAGANFATVSFSELWGYKYEEGERLFEELTPIPLIDCLRIIDSYAGFEGESNLLQRVWDRGLSGQRVSDEWPIYRKGKQLSYIHQGEDAQRRCWRGTEAERVEYYGEQKDTLRPGTYRRLHLNEWASSEDAFILPEQWDALVDTSYRVPGPSKAVRLYVACDIGVKRDHSAVVSVYREDKELKLGPYRVWKPVSGKEVDLQAVEDYLVELWQSYGIATLCGDPSQFLHIKQRLQTKGITVTEFIQSTSRLTEAGNTLFDVVKQARLSVYSGASDLREYVLNAKAKETPRGIRLIKDTASKKIDAAIALAMAVCEAEQKGSGPPPAGTTIEDIDIGTYKPERHSIFKRRHYAIY
ncbi:MAG: hypothetical protein KDJ52_15525 [Anaerolineae bacterium]|nr:hypothetical protein [Anaerolineae bacterium]